MASKQHKEDVDYSESTGSERCGNCSHFSREHEDCTKVSGHILARMWCKLWSSRKRKPKLFD